METSTEQQETALEKVLSSRFSQAQIATSLENLFVKIISRISNEAELKKLKTKLWASFGALAVTLGLLTLAVDVSFRAFTQTPSFNFLSLIFTDFKIVAYNWQDYGFSILENLPLGALAFLLSSILASFLLFDLASHQFSNLRKLLKNQAHG